MIFRSNRFITACVLTLVSANAYSQVSIDSTFASYDFVGATYHVPISSFVPLVSASITNGGTIEGYAISPTNTIAKFTGGSFSMSGGTVHAINNFFWHNNFLNDTVSGGTFASGGVQFTNMQTGGFLDISGGVFPGSVSVSGYDGAVTVSGGPSSMTVPNPGPNASLTFTGTGWTWDPAGPDPVVPLVFVGNQADLTDIGFGTLKGILADGTSFQVVLGGTGFSPGIPIVTVVDQTLPPNNNPPVAVCEDVTLSLDASGQATLTADQVDGGSFDPDGDQIFLSIDRTVFTCADIGENTVTLTVDDGQETASCEAIVTLEDNSAPVPDVAVLSDVTGECSATILSAPTATDNCAGVVAGTTADPLTYAEQGTYTVTWTYDDGNGNTSQQVQQIVVNDVTGPVLSVITNRITLWPPNHKYVTIAVSDLVVSVSDNCADLASDAVVITSVFSDEEEDVEGDGDGATTEDIAFPDGCCSVDLRAERLDSGNGRVYTIHLAVSDGNGNTGTATCIVEVPYGKKDSAVADEPIYGVACD